MEGLQIKKFNTKSIFAVTLAAVMAMSMAATANAEVAETATDNSLQTNTGEGKDTVWIGDFECWVVDGHYLTNWDGEICEVINLDELEWTRQENSSDIESQISVQADNEVDVSNGYVYYGTIDATENDYNSPVFVGWHRSPSDSDFPNARLAYTIKCEDFVVNRQHSVEIRSFYYELNEYITTTTNLVFTAFTKTKILYSGVWSTAPTKIRLTFPKGDGNKKKTDYSFYATITKY